MVSNDTELNAMDTRSVNKCPDTPIEHTYRYESSLAHNFFQTTFWTRETMRVSEDTHFLMKV